MTQSSRLLAEKVRDDIKYNLQVETAENIVDEVIKENKRIVYRG